jgi:uncharacterized membrane protein YccC
VLQRAVDGLLAAMAGWARWSVVLARLPKGRAREEASAVLAEVPEELRAQPGQDEAARWMANPAGLLRVCDAAVRTLLALPARTPSLQLLADQTADVLAGISHALNGLALLVTDPFRPVVRDFRRLRIPDWLPPLVNAGRAFVVIGAAQLFWIATEWPNGAGAMTFAAIGVILLAPRADQAYAAAVGFTVGTSLTAAFAAIIGFAVLPNRETFAGLSLVIGLVLVPAGAGLASSSQLWRAVMFMAMVANFVPLLAPANVESYDTQQFYNAASAIVAGSSAAAFSFRLMPPLSPAFRARRLLGLTLRDLRRLATGLIPDTDKDWQEHVFGRLAALPDAAQPLQRAQLIAALLIGTEIIKLRHFCRRFDLGSDIDAALDAFARGNSVTAVARLADLDRALTLGLDAAALRARGIILGISETLARHAAYFDGATG